MCIVVMKSLRSIDFFLEKSADFAYNKLLVYLGLLS